MTVRQPGRLTALVGYSLSRLPNYTQAMVQHEFNVISTKSRQSSGVHSLCLSWEQLNKIATLHRDNGAAAG